MKKTLGSSIGDIFKLNLEKITRNFYILTFASVIVGIVIYLAVSSIWSEVRTVKEGSLPQLIQTQQTDLALEGINIVLEKLFDAEIDMVKQILFATVKETNAIYKVEFSKLSSTLQRETDEAIKSKLNRASNEYLKVFEGGIPKPDEVFPKLTDLKEALSDLRNFTLDEIDRDFAASESAKNKATIVIILLTLAAIIGMIITSLVLTGVVTQPVSRVAETLAANSKDIEDVTDVISSGARSQTELVKKATEDLEDMIINTIQGSITMSVEKQGEIAKGFSDFLRQFVERTTAEIAMGMMSVSGQSQEAREGMQEFVSELKTVEDNIRSQENSIGGMVEALKGIVSGNVSIKGKAKSSTEAADIATAKAYEGQEQIGRITTELQEVRIASEGVKDITESLAKITENIKILALNMSLKVEDIRDDTGKSYGFETMSARVQELAEEVEKLLIDSTGIIIPTIDAIEKVSTDAANTKELITEVAKAIKVADDESKAIATEIDRQTGEISKVESISEELSEIAKTSTESITAQAKRVAEVEELLGDSVALIDGVNEQTKESSDAARKVNDIMDELRASMASIEEGTGKLTEKSFELSEVFETISENTNKSLDGAEMLESVTSAVRDVSKRLATVVKGSAATDGGATAAPLSPSTADDKGVLLAATGTPEATEGVVTEAAEEAREDKKPAAQA